MERMEGREWGTNRAEQQNNMWHKLYCQLFILGPQLQFTGTVNKPSSKPQPGLLVSRMFICRLHSCVLQCCG